MFGFLIETEASTLAYLLKCGLENYFTFLKLLCLSLCSDSHTLNISLTVLLRVDESATGIV